MSKPKAREIYTNHQGTFLIMRGLAHCLERQKEMVIFKDVMKRDNQPYLLPLKVFEQQFEKISFGDLVKKRFFK